VAGSTALITSEHLLVEDGDTPADEIVYTLESVATNGDVIVDGDGVTSFTQQLINDSKVYFAHRGDLTYQRLTVGLHLISDILCDFYICVLLVSF